MAFEAGLSFAKLKVVTRLVELVSRIVFASISS